MFDDCEYDGDPGIRFSRLKTMAISPLAYICPRPVPDSYAVRLGTAVDAVLLHGRVLSPFDGRRAGRAWDDHVAHCDEIGAIPVSGREGETIEAICDAVRDHPVAGRILRESEYQRAVYWQHASGRRLKGLIDMLRIADHGVFDLKVTASIAPHVLHRHVARMQWHVQASHYADGVREVFGLTDLPPRGLICVEAARPHDCVVLEIDDVTAAAALADRDRWLERLAECDASGIWPGQYDATTTHPLILPPWVMGDDPLDGLSDE